IIRDCGSVIETEFFTKLQPVSGPRHRHPFITGHRSTSTVRPGAEFPPSPGDWPIHTLLRTEPFGAGKNSAPALLRCAPVECSSVLAPPRSRSRETHATHPRATRPVLRVSPCDLVPEHLAARRGTRLRRHKKTIAQCPP